MNDYKLKEKEIQKVFSDEVIGFDREKYELENSANKYEVKSVKKARASIKALLIGASILGLSLGLPTSNYILHKIDTNIDHVHEYCPFNKILGEEHQIHELEKLGYHAELVEAGDVIGQEEKSVKVTSIEYVETPYEEIIDATITTMPDGTIRYSAPLGGVLVGDKVVKKGVNIEQQQVIRDKIVTEDVYAENNMIKAKEVKYKVTFNDETVRFLSEDELVSLKDVYDFEVRETEHIIEAPTRTRK